MFIQKNNEKNKEKYHAALIPPFAMVAGPCAIESYEMFSQVASFVAKQGATHLRGGIFKLRTRSDSFQGLREQAMEMVQTVKKEVKLPFIAEITDPRQLASLDAVVDIFQIGARNMYNYELLKDLALQSKPVLLKRGFSATMEEWLMAAEYITKKKNAPVILCERGIRTFEKMIRNTLDLGSASLAQQLSGYPVWVDPSHATGMKSLVSPMAKAAVAAGLDGLMIEVHPDPDTALSDKEQALDLETFACLSKNLFKIRQCIEGKVFL